MEGLLFTIALVAAGVIWWSRTRRPERDEGPPQSTDPPGETSAPDDWPRDGGDNPSGP